MDAPVTESQMRTLIAKKVAEYGGQTALAEAMGISAQYLHDILRHNKPISDNVARFFGKKLVKLYIPMEKTNASNSG